MLDSAQLRVAAVSIVQPGQQIYVNMRTHAQEPVDRWTIHRLPTDLSTDLVDEMTATLDLLSGETRH